MLLSLGKSLMRRPLTTVFGIAAIGLGLVGGALVFGSLLSLGAPPVLLSQRILSLATKVALVLTGVFLLRRSRGAVALLLVTLLFSLADSAVTYALLLEPAPSGLSQAGQVGRAFGRVVGLVLPLVCYLGLLGYLLLPKTRMEFRSTGPGGRVAR